jgi:hypothetical protein
MSHYHALHIADFLDAILEDRPPAVDGREGRKHVELFTAVYRSQRDGRPVRSPLSADLGADFFDGRLNPTSRPSSQMPMAARVSSVTPDTCSVATSTQYGPNKR